MKDTKADYDAWRPHANRRITLAYVALDNYYKYGRPRGPDVNEVGSGTRELIYFSVLTLSASVRCLRGDISRVISDLRCLFSLRIVYRAPARRRPLTAPPYLSQQHICVIF